MTNAFPHLNVTATTGGRASAAANFAAKNNIRFFQLAVIVRLLVFEYGFEGFADHYGLREFDIERDIPTCFRLRSDHLALAIFTDFQIDDIVARLPNMQMNRMMTWAETCAALLCPLKGLDALCHTEHRFQPFPARFGCFDDGKPFHPPRISAACLFVKLGS